MITMLIFSTISSKAKGEDKSDSLLLREAQNVNKNFPYANMVDFQYTYYTPSSIKTKVKGQDFLDTKMNFQQWLTTSVNLPLLITPSFMIINSFKYQYATLNLENSGSEAYHDIRNYLTEAEAGNSYTEALNFIYIGKAFEKKITCILNISADFSDHGYERINGSLAVTLEIKHTDRTSISLGMMGTTDPLASTPIVPLISVFHWFSDKYYLDCVAPSYLYIRRIYANKSRLSIGTNLSSYQSFTHPSIPSLTSFTYQRGKVELAAIYEKNLCAGLNLFSKVGYVMNLRDKVSLTNSDNTTMFISQKPNFSINIGATYNFIPQKYRTTNQ
jgi:hypothetical protein